MVPVTLLPLVGLAGMREFGGEVVGAQGLTMTQLIPFLGGAPEE